MSNGYLIAAGADVAAARDISDGFGLEVIDAANITNPNETAAQLAAAANVGLMIGAASASDSSYVALLHVLAQTLARAQLILVDPDARTALPFLPEAWPVMSLDEARARSDELVRRRNAESETQTTPSPTPSEPAPEPQPAPHGEAPADGGELETESSPTAETQADSDQNSASEIEAGDEAADETITDAEHQPTAPEPESATEEAPALESHATEPAPAHEEEPVVGASRQPEAPDDTLGASQDEAPAPQPPEPSPLPAAPPQVQPTPAPATLQQSTGGARSPEPPPKTRSRAENGSAATAPADATAFAPKKLRRGTPEVIQIAIHQPKDLKAVMKSAKKLDPRAEPAPQGMSIGDIALGASVAVSLEARGGACSGELQRRAWTGDPLNFVFSFEADDAAKQAVFFARVFVNDAQIGAIAFQRPISGAAKKAASRGDGVRLKRYKRVFISYSAKDRETVAAIATAYQSAGVQHFWDRASLKSGEEWSPRLRKEIDRADLFHLCWSKAASSSQWVEKETEHALTRRKRSNGKHPDITVQMLDGPPWAPHPPELDSINFDDFVRAAIVGYARGDGSS